MYFPNPEITELLTFALDSFFDCDLSAYGSAPEMVQALRAGLHPQLLVLDAARDDMPVVLEIAKKMKLKVAIHHPKKITPTVEGVDIVGVFNEPELLVGISNALKALGAGVKNPLQVDCNPQYPYFRVGIPLLTRTNPLVADVYVKLSDLKYVKLFHKGAPFGEEEVAKYRSRRLDYFYVKRGEADALTCKLNDALEELLRLMPLPPEISTKVSLATIDTVHSLVNQVGFTPEVQRLVKNNVDLVMKEMYASPSLGSILQNMALGKEQYISAHSHMLAEVSCALAIAMRWDSETSFKKLTMAALLHDMSLSNQKLAQVKNLKELTARFGEFSSIELDDYRTHPRRAATLVTGFKEVPADVDKIILQHHELPMGTGFPDAINHVHIHPLASLMNVAHDLVDWVIDRPGAPPDMEAFIAAHEDKYKVGNFKKILKAILSLQA